MIIRFLLVGLLLLSALTACGAPTTPSVPPSVPTAPVDAPSTATPPINVPLLPTATPAPSVTPTAPVIAATVPVDSSGPANSVTRDIPHLVFPTADGLMSAAANGTSLQLFGDARPAIAHQIKDGLSPVGGWVAFASGANPMTPDPEGSGPLTLNLLKTVDGTLMPITPLFSPDLEEVIRSATTTGDRNDAVEAGIAIMDNSDTLKWSPDGRYLAFIAAIDGPSSDVYSYDRETGQINRLTDGLNQAARLFWSPDSQWIVHEEVENFGTGAGWSVKAVWAAAPDGNTTRKLYDTEWSGDEVFVEWITPEKFLVYSWTEVGWRDVRVVDLNTGEAQRIGPEFEVQTLAYDPETQTQLYYVADFTAEQHDLKGGLYLAGPQADQPELIAAGDWYETRWLPRAQLFFAKGPAGVMSVTPDNIVEQYAEEEALPIESPDGAWLLAWGDGNYTSPIGLRLYATDSVPADEVTRTITSEAVAFATWSLDATGVFYQSEGQLYFVEIPNGEPVLLGETTARELSNIGWVKP
jgi:hypothetical protein